MNEVNSFCLQGSGEQSNIKVKVVHLEGIGKTRKMNGTNLSEHLSIFFNSICLHQESFGSEQFHICRRYGMQIYNLYITYILVLKSIVQI